MFATSALLLLSTVSAPPADLTLLDFYSPACHHCQTMEPTIDRLARSGVPVRKINVQQQPELARRYRVSSVPCFVVVAGGREQDRVLGATSHDRLLQMVRRAGSRAGGSPPVANRAASNSAPSRPIASRPTPSRPGPQSRPKVRGQSPDQGAAAGNSAATPQQRALQATVRLRIADDRGTSYGTGTIIDLHGNEALVLTCGHIFRDSAGKGKITVDLFGPQGTESVPGQVVAYDAEQRDIGLVSMRLNRPVTPVRVAPQGHRSFRGDQVFSIGCDRGADPSIRPSHVSAINKYVGPANIEVAGQPVDGRSGGGLFTADGMLMGVCNAADPQDNEGIYAAVETIHWQLAQVGQQRLFAAEQVAAAPAQPPAAPQPSRPAADLGAAAPVAVSAPVAVAQGLAPALRQGERAEVIFVVRGQDGGSRAVVLDQLPPELVTRLLNASRSMTTARPGAPAAAAAAVAESPRGMTIRGQSPGDRILR